MQPHFALLREEVTFGRRKKKPADTPPKFQVRDVVENGRSISCSTLTLLILICAVLCDIPFFTLQLLFVNLLREYLDEEFKTELPFGYDLERVIDDFILFCFFVGT